MNGSSVETMAPPGLRPDTAGVDERMAMYQGKSIRVTAIEEGFVELCFDRVGDAINKFDARTVAELKEAVAVVAAAPGVRGVLATSAKDVFVVGADITEFGEKFRLPHADLVEDVRGSNEAFVAWEDLALPTVVAIDGYALGGGFEFVLACALRVASQQAQVGLPEVKLGLFPGFGGTVRLLRVAGAQTAVQWITDGKPRTADAALAAGALDAVSDRATLRATALDLLRGAAAGSVDWRAAQHRKRKPLNGNGSGRCADFAAWRARVAAENGPHLPAALAAVDLMERSAALDRDAALALESEAFARVAHTQAASSLVQTFLNEQVVRKAAKRRVQGAQPLRQAVVLGAGIMGGGIALTSALHGVPVRISDVSSKALDGALGEAGRQLARRVASGRLSQPAADAARDAITTQTGAERFAAADIVVEAIVEWLQTKHEVLAALEPRLGEATVLASNTSSLRIDDIAQALRQPERFVGMHFFNPVPSMPLVEVVQGRATSEAAVATAVAYAQRDEEDRHRRQGRPGLPGQTRVLMAYLGAALRLVADGADYEAVDRAMEAFGWPMGPSYLAGRDRASTPGSHVADVIAGRLSAAHAADRARCLEADAGARPPGPEDGCRLLPLRARRQGPFGAAARPAGPGPGRHAATCRPTQLQRRGDRGPADAALHRRGRACAGGRRGRHAGRAGHGVAAGPWAARPTPAARCSTPTGWDWTRWCGAAMRCANGARCTSRRHGCGSWRRGAGGSTRSGGIEGRPSVVYARRLMSLPFGSTSLASARPLGATPYLTKRSNRSPGVELQVQ